MLDKHLSTAGEVRVQRHRVEVEGFDADDCMCREVAVLALLWAIGELQRELKELVQQPGGSGKVVVTGE